MKKPKTPKTPYKRLREDKEFLSGLGKVEDQEIAEKFGVSVTFVAKVRRELGIHQIHKFPKGIENYAGKMTDKEAAAKLNCQVRRVFEYRCEHNINSYRRKTRYTKTQQIIDDYEKLGTLQKVADKYGCTREWIRQVLSNAGYTKRFYNFAERG